MARASSMRPVIAAIALGAAACTFDDEKGSGTARPDGGAFVVRRGDTATATAASGHAVAIAPGTTGAGSGAGGAGHAHGTGGVMITTSTSTTPRPVVTEPPPAGARLVAAGAVVDLALDATYVYFADIAAGTLARAPKAGGAAQVLASGLDRPVHVAVGPRDALVQTNDGHVRRVPLAGGDAVIVGASRAPGVVALDGDRAAWGDNAYPGAIFAAPLGGGDAAKLVDGKSLGAEAVAVSGLAIEAGTVIFADLASFAVRAVPAAGGSVTTLADGLARAPLGLAIGAGAAWVAQGAEGTILGVPLAGGPPVVVMTPGDAPGVIAVDGSRAYYAVGGATGGAAIRSVPLGGGLATTTLGGLALPPMAIAVDGSSVFYADGEGVFAAPK